jgi:hypothetical protein
MSVDFLFFVEYFFYMNFVFDFKLDNSIQNSFSFCDEFILRSIKRAHPKAAMRFFDSFLQ